MPVVPVADVGNAESNGRERKNGRSHGSGQSCVYVPTARVHRACGIVPRDPPRGSVPVQAGHPVLSTGVPVDGRLRSAFQPREHRAPRRRCRLHGNLWCEKKGG